MDNNRLCDTKRMTFLFKHLQTTQAWVPLVKKLSTSATHNILKGAWRRKGEVIVERYGKPSMVLSTMWLRDHCRAEDRYSYQTNQRAVDLKTANLAVEPFKVEVEDENLFVNWEDGRNSSYNISWIDKNYHLEATPPPKLWGHIEQEDVLLNSQVTWKEFTNSDTGVETLLSSLIKYDT